MSDPMYIACPCCGFRTIQDTHDVCPVCRWEHDPVQSDDPDFPEGANRVSLRQGQRNFVEFGACEREQLPHAHRPHVYERDPNWRPLGVGG